MVTPVPIAPQYAEDLTRAHARFAELLAAVHGLQPAALSENVGSTDDAADLGAAEMRAMVRAYLGDGYDEVKVQALVDDQRNLQLHHAALLDTYERGLVSERDYALQLNEALLISADHCRRVLGPADFDRLFGYVPAHFDLDALWAPTSQ